MPELPDISLYLERLEERLTGATLERIVLASPFLLRSVEPPLADTFGKKVLAFQRLGKRIVFDLEDDLHLVLHLMIAGRLRWADKTPAKVPGKIGLALFVFSRGTLILTEASSKKRASLNVVHGSTAAFERGGLEPLTATRAEFVGALTRENHTLKRSLTDPRLFSGIGNAYSDEILFAAKLSPIKQSQKLSEEELSRLYVATQETLRMWIARLREETPGFPEKVTAFREGMAVHGRYRKPCPVCGTPVQRIRYAENETNYCAKCQNAGRLLADRGLSRLLHSDWPKTLEELEDYKAVRRQ